jgi:hypothetical protein
MTMPPATLAALKASIAHWNENIAAETPEDVGLGSDECALCGLFFKNSCRRCPISRRTGRQSCMGTPYLSADQAWCRWDRKTDPTTHAAWIIAATAMRDYLVALLPEGEAP